METKVLIIILLLLTMVRAASKYYDGPIRPYEFGFNIEGHQHRKESKDKNGIIMGEFGFITADNVYHVTVYATDADGNFKIVSMKNYKLGPTTLPPPPPPPPSPPPPTTTTTPAPTTTSTTPQPFRIITTAKPIVPLTTPKPSNVATCSGCKIPEPPVPSTQPPLPETSTLYVPPFKIVNKNDLEPVGGGKTTPGSMVTTTAGSVSGPVEPPADVPQKLVESKGSKEGSERQQQGGGSGTSSAANATAGERSEPRKEPNRSKEQTSGERKAPKEDQPQSHSRSEAPKKDGRGSTGTDKDDPMKLIEIHTANMIQHILNGLLYRFNYTAGYHGHHEQGDRQGNKEGGYYAIGRDGIRRGVSYKANEFGYQPHIKFEKVSPEETPREETEKQAGLKGFDFKWFYGS
uniref:Uncharacterized protein n=1 Tax=Anopheles coluzzii TaxID=1518534 RepID=A0A6E8VNK7_ANOCL